MSFKFQVSSFKLEFQVSHLAVPQVSSFRFQVSGFKLEFQVSTPSGSILFRRAIPHPR